MCKLLTLLLSAVMAMRMVSIAVAEEPLVITVL